MFEFLKAPIAGEQPAGIDVSKSNDWIALSTAWPVFGQPLPRDPNDPNKEPDWAGLRKATLGWLDKTRDLSVLALLAAAVARTDGWLGYLELVTLADGWIEQWGDHVYPRPEGKDYRGRSSALSSLGDVDAIIGPLRRCEIIKAPMLGPFSLSAWESAKGEAGKPTPGVSAGRKADLEAIRAKMDPAAQAALVTAVDAALGALQRLDTRMDRDGGSQARPDFDNVVATLRRLRSALPTPNLPDDSKAGPSMTVTGGSGGGEIGASIGSSSVGVGTIASRADVERALVAVAEYLRATEPTNPVQLLIERARGLLQKRDFLEVLADLAPDALAAASKVVRGPEKK